MPGTLAEALTIAVIVPSVLGFMQSYIFELWPFWGKLAPQYKRLVMMVVAVGLALAVQAANTYIPESTITELEPWYAAIAAGVLLVSAEVTHSRINGPKF